MLLSLSLNRLFSARSTRRSSIRRTAHSQVEATEPRLYLSATAFGSSEFAGTFETEFVEDDLAWLDDWWYEDDFDSAEWDTDFEFVDEFELDWFVADAWYEYETTDDESWWTDEVVYEDLWFDLTTDFDVTADFDAHAMDDELGLDFETVFVCELFFEDEATVTEVLLEDEFLSDDGVFFDPVVFDTSADAVLTDDFYADEIVFVDEFVLVDAADFQDDVFVDDFATAVFEDVFVDASFDETFDAEFFDEGGFLFEETVPSDFEIVVTTETESVVVDVVVFDDSLNDPVSGDFLAEVESVVTEAIADVHSANEDFIDISAGVDAASDSLVSEILDVIVEVDSEFIDGDTVPVVTAVTVVSEIVETTDVGEEFIVFEDITESVVTAEPEAIASDVVAVPEFLVVGLTQDETSVSEPVVSAGVDQTGNAEVTISSDGSGSISASTDSQQPGDAEFAVATLPGAAASAVRIDGRTGLPVRHSAHDALSSRLRVNAKAQRLEQSASSTQAADASTRQDIPVVGQAAVQSTPETITHSQGHAATPEQQSARSQFEFRMRREAASASLLTTSSRSDSQSISYDAELLTFEHPALIMRLNGLTPPAPQNDADSGLEQQDHQPGYAQMVSAAGTLAIGGAAGIQFTHRRGWSVLLRLVRALVGRV